MSQALEYVERTYSSVEACFRRAQSLAFLDALISPEWQYRYYSMNVAWSAGQQMASVRNGEGDYAFFLFSTGMCCFKELNHGQSDHLPEVTEFIRKQQATLPDVVQHVLDEPAFYVDECTVLGWCEVPDEVWHELRSVDIAGQENPRLSALLLTGTPEDYVAWAEEYYEQEISVEGVQRVFDHEPLREALVQSINPALTLLEVLEDAHEIGYPLAELPI